MKSRQLVVNTHVTSEPVPSLNDGRIPGPAWRPVWYKHLIPLSLHSSGFQQDLSQVYNICLSLNFHSLLIFKVLPLPTMFLKIFAALVFAASPALATVFVCTRKYFPKSSDFSLDHPTHRFVYFPRRSTRHHQLARWWFYSFSSRLRKCCRFYLCRKCTTTGTSHRISSWFDF